MPPEGFDFLPYRAAPAMMLAVASTGAEDYRTAQELLGLEPFHSSGLATFTAKLALNETSRNDPVAAAYGACQHGPHAERPQPSRGDLRQARLVLR